MDEGNWDEYVRLQRRWMEAERVAEAARDEYMSFVRERFRPTGA